LKINHDLERIGDLAVNIARKVRGLVFDPPPELTCDLGLMCEKTQALLRDSIDSLVSLKAAEAASICTRDDEIDQMKATIRKEIETAIRQQPGKVGSLLRLLAVSRNLERIADLATSIAEDGVTQRRMRGFRCSFHPARGASFSKPRDDLISSLQFRRVADDPAVGDPLRQAVASRQHTQGAERFQARGLLLDLAAGQEQPLPPRTISPGIELVEAQGKILDALERTAKGAVRGDCVQSRLGRCKPPTQGCGKPLLRLPESGQEILGGRGHQFGRLAGRQGANVGHEVGQGHVDLMTDG
jgi:hypothetical protein